MEGIAHIRTLINEICREIQAGDIIIYESDAHNLRWIWKNARTQEKRFIRVHDFKKASIENKTMTDILIPFIINASDPIKTKIMLERYDQLQSFW
jgi:hypothetical protein